jgi:hypothetical protein
VEHNLLRQVYAATHPAAFLNQPETETTARNAGAAAELLDALAAEADSESDDDPE